MEKGVIQPTVKGSSKSDNWISKEIKRLIEKEGYDQQRAVAIAHKKAGRSKSEAKKALTQYMKDCRMNKSIADKIRENCGVIKDHAETLKKSQAEEAPEGNFIKDPFASKGDALKLSNPSYAEKADELDEAIEKSEKEYEPRGGAPIDNPMKEFENLVK